METEYEVPLPKLKSKQTYYTKKQSNYVNPFKVQQELEEKRKAKELETLQRLAKAKLAEQERKAALERLEQEKRAERERQKELERLAKIQREEERKAAQAAAAQAKTSSLPTNQNESAKPKKTSILDKKLVINIKKPKLPKILSRKPVTQTHTADAPQKRAFKHTRIFVGSSLVIVLLAGCYYFSPAKVTPPPPTPENNNTVETQVRAVTPPAAKLAAEVGKQVSLPTDEEPDSATVIDRNKLQNQEFFKNAQNGDKILMYKRNQKAFLYRQSTDEIIAMATLVFQDTAGAATSSASFEDATSL